MSKGFLAISLLFFHILIVNNANKTSNNINLAYLGITSKLGLSCPNAISDTGGLMERNRPAEGKWLQLPWFLLEPVFLSHCSVDPSLGTPKQLFLHLFLILLFLMFRN